MREGTVPEKDQRILERSVLQTVPKINLGRNLDGLLLIGPSWGVELPPLNLALLKSALTSQNFRVQCIDLNYSAYKFSQNKKLWDKNSLRSWTLENEYEKLVKPWIDEAIGKWAEQIVEAQPLFVGLSILDSNIHFSNSLAREIKARVPQTIIIAGGPEVFTRESRIKLGPAFDYYLNGEGEEAIGEFILFLRSGQKSSLPNGFYSTQEPLHRHLPFRAVSDLSSFPPPDFSDFELNQYTLSAIPLIASRSCLFKCRFCSDYSSMGSFRKVKPEQLIKQLKQAYKAGYRKAWFNDLLINGVIPELLETFQTIEKEGMHFEWIALATPNRQLKIEQLKELHRLGLKTLNLGLESGSPKVMKLMRKGFNLKQSQEALERIHQAGINSQINMIVGFPGENEEDFQETLSFLDRNKHQIAGFTSVNDCILLPGSEIFDRREEFGIELPESMDPTQWFLGSENTETIRKDRLHRLKEWIERNGYSLYSSNR